MPSITGPCFPLARRVAREVGTGLLRIVYPMRCIGCGAAAETPGGLVCPRCLGRPERVAPHEVAERLTRLPPAAAAQLEGGFALWHFEKGGLLQELQHALKYGNRPALGVFLGERMGDAMDGAVSGEVIVPVPLHPLRYLERGYNQSVMLARGAARTLDRPVCEDALRRTRATRSQTALGRTGRWDNVAGAFEVAAPEALHGRRLLLVDDVLTTGATAAAAAQALRAAGAAAVFVAALGLANV